MHRALLVATVAAAMFAWVAPSCAQDYPQGADMRPMGAAEGRYQPADSFPTSSEIRKRYCSPEEQCIFIVNLSHRIVKAFRYAISLDPGTGQYNWSGNILPPQGEFFNNKWSFIRKPSDMTCRIAFRVTLSDRGRLRDYEDVFDFCGQVSSYITVRPPHSPYVVVEPSPSDK